MYWIKKKNDPLIPFEDRPVKRSSNLIGWVF